MRQEGIQALTVSSVGMAEYFAKDGWTDILIAFPCNVREITQINKLAQKTSLMVIVDSPDTVAKLDRRLEAELGILIEIDSGYGRTGVPWNEKESIQFLARMVGASDKLKFLGYYTHAGHTYNARSTDEIQEIGEDAISNFESAVDGEFEHAIYGDTPSCSVINSFGSIVTALSPGNFVFYDLMQVGLCACKEKDIAIALECPVVSISESRNEVVIHGGAVHLSGHGAGHF